MRLPYRERLSLILNELGTGLAGRGEDARPGHPPRRPGAQGGRQGARASSRRRTRCSQDLARNSDTMLAPLARERRHVSGVHRATRRGRPGDGRARAATSRPDIEKLPDVPARARPTMTRLGALSDEMTPVFADLRRRRARHQPHDHPARPVLAGRRSRRSSRSARRRRSARPAITAARPVDQATCATSATARKPVGATARQLLESFQKTQGIERLMDYIFYQVAAINGFDEFGHYLRAGLIVNTCSTTTIRPIPGCSANFALGDRRRRPPARGGAAARPVAARTAAALREAPTPRDKADGDRRRPRRAPRRSRPRRRRAATPAPAGDAARPRATRCSTTCSEDGG